MYLNQSLDEIISTVLFIILFFIISIVISFLFLKGNLENKVTSKTIIPNIIFYVILFISYQLAIEKNINISVFSPNESYEKKWLIFSFIFIYFLGTFSQVLVYNLTSKIKLSKQYIGLIMFLNFITLSIILFNFYPKSYVNKNIKNYDRILYIPNKFELKLFNGSYIEIDSACTSKNNYTDNSEHFSYEFRIPIIQNGNDRMLYSFRLLDKSLQVGTSGEDDNCKSISISSIENEICAIFIQKNPDPNIGWEKEIITDTIVFKKVKTEKRKAGYYGDTDCDCIEH